ncbi:hypothetical protein AUEXF2481DRAFT_418916 [Aureobasidium subglaciale EXF-2481]|uniref:Uncharacterized protein n=1 Tax=Aureobasidium subglaciale (strain EXF-2481) TaxID=1043005 RepID=A0A074YE86_AURSE|nr:uncharacterized protein AUEXF2481DRAFT_418916 [Aureobasidium subglaciale EXF-2481]KEQ92437.1 hypothetical protein AUEXF2481DRAFT_418916 [Aureobasidium subglaciale EXF-2481]
MLWSTIKDYTLLLFASWDELFIFGFLTLNDHSSYYFLFATRCLDVNSPRLRKVFFRFRYSYIKDHL